MAFNVNALGFGDNVVDRYEHIHTMYPGGNDRARERGVRRRITCCRRQPNLTPS